MSFAGTIDGKHALHRFFDVSNNKVQVLYFDDHIGMPIYLQGGIGSGRFVIANDAEQFSGRRRLPVRRTRVDSGPVAQHPEQYLHDCTVSAINRRE